MEGWGTLGGYHDHCEEWVQSPSGRRALATLSLSCARGSPAPGSWLPSFTSSFLWRPSNSYRAERLLRARHSPYICDKTDMVLPSGFLQLREGDVAKEMTGHHTIRATRENDSAL